MAQPTDPASSPMPCAAYLRFIICSLLVASPPELLGLELTLTVPVLAAVALCRGVYGTYRWPWVVSSAIEDGEEPGESNGCAVSDSLDGVRAKVPERPMDVAGKRWSRLVVIVPVKA